MVPTSDSIALRAGAGTRAAVDALSAVAITLQACGCMGWMVTADEPSTSVALDRRRAPTRYITSAATYVLERGELAQPPRHSAHHACRSSDPLINRNYRPSMVAELGPTGPQRTSLGPTHPGPGGRRPKWKALRKYLQSARFLAT